jgi:coenzyme F420-reducing hydrogenase delta subunit
MFVIEVIPLQHLPKNVSQILTYYCKTPIIKGAVVEISIQTKKINALVISSTPIETIKETLKTNTFSLKKINKIVLEKSLVDKSF